VRLQDPDRTAIPLDLFAVPDARQVKNRVHPDLIPSGEEGDRESQRREVERALSLGALRVDIGQGDATWEVLIDTEGNELRVLGPRRNPLSPFASFPPARVTAANPGARQ
jgi:hypothetical protein